MRFDDYQDRSRTSDQKADDNSLHFPLLGLFGESGSLLTALKKREREGKAIVAWEETIEEEFGDVLWYFSSIASKEKIRLSLIAVAAASADNRRTPNADANYDFATFQVNLAKNVPGTSDFAMALLSLAGRVGTIADQFAQGRLDGNHAAVTGLLVETFRSLGIAANASGVDLAKAANANLQKIQGRWPTNRIYTAPYDDDFDDSERLPRDFEMQIEEKVVHGKSYVIQRMNGINIGDRLTDNKKVDDDYRFHDVFHLAYVGILGWSPVTRALLKLKRKSKAKIDEAEDGQRAIVTEEGVSAIVFQHALGLNLFEGMKSIDYSLLKQVVQFVNGYEVAESKSWEWEEAILRGFDVFRKLKETRRGIVAVSLSKRSIDFRPLP